MLLCAARAVAKFLVALAAQLSPAFTIAAEAFAGRWPLVNQFAQFLSQCGNSRLSVARQRARSFQRLKRKPEVRQRLTLAAFPPLNVAHGYSEFYGHRFSRLAVVRKPFSKPCRLFGMLHRVVTQLNRRQTLLYSSNGKTLSVKCAPRKQKSRAAHNPHGSNRNREQ